MNELMPIASPTQSILEIFNFEGNQVRTVSILGEPWFVAGDVSKALDYSEAYKMTRNLDSEDQGPHLVGTLGGTQQMLVINESGLYTAIMKSRKPEAKRFQKWVTSVLLPGIRKKEFVHVSEVQVSAGILQNLSNSYESMRRDMEELKNAFRAAQGSTTLAISKEATPLAPGEMSRVEIRRRGLLSTAELAKKVGVSTHRFDALLDVLGLHEKVSRGYVATAKARGYFDIVGEVTERNGSKRKKHLWKEIVISMIPREYLPQKSS